MPSEFVKYLERFQYARLCNWAPENRASGVQLEISESNMKFCIRLWSYVDVDYKFILSFDDYLYEIVSYTEKNF